MMMVKRLAGVALGALLAVNAFAFFGETEPNNTRATPDVLVFDAANGYTAPWSDVGVLSLTANDSDFFKIWLNTGDWLTAITFPIRDELLSTRHRDGALRWHQHHRDCL
jgi:hypothetical protein